MSALFFYSFPMSPSSPWLDRLRSSKGFPSVDAPSLDHFLAHHLPASLPVHLPPRDLSAPPQEDPCLLPRILSDLFCIAPSSSQLPRHKLPRKQPNPRSFSLPLLSAAVQLHASDSKTPVRIPEEELVPSSNSDNTTEGPKFKRAPDAGLGDDEEEFNGDSELTGYSRSEVTVIDTSCQVWKSDLVVFRRRNVWKIRAKKGKLRSYGRKKRSQGSHDRIHAITSSASGKNIANAFTLQDLSSSNQRMPVGTD